MTAYYALRTFGASVLGGVIGFSVYKVGRWAQTRRQWRRIPAVVRELTRCRSRIMLPNGETVTVSTRFEVNPAGDIQVTFHLPESGAPAVVPEDGTIEMSWLPEGRNRIGPPHVS